MNIYLAGERKPFPTTARRRLVTYWYHREPGALEGEGISNSNIGDLFLDSGAYSAWVKGQTISVDEYAKFIHDSKIKWTVISNLDVIRDPEKTYENQKALESLGVKACPVFHTKEDLKWLQRYVDEGYPYLLMGGLAKGGSLPTVMAWLDRAWKNCLMDEDGEAKIKVHGFGVTAQSLMYRYPWHSVDSTTWLALSNYGRCLLNVSGEMRAIAFSDKNPATSVWGQHFDTLSKVEQDLVAACLNEMGKTIEQVRTHYTHRDEVNAQSFFLSEKFKPKEISTVRKTLF